MQKMYIIVPIDYTDNDRLPPYGKWVSSDKTSLVEKFKKELCELNEEDHDFELDNAFDGSYCDIIVDGNSDCVYRVYELDVV